jgi:glycerol-3-phosphate acyltransferase PlsY
MNAGDTSALNLHAALACLVGYLLGSIPFGLILTRAAGLGDIRAIGSGNIGATNVLRTGRRDIAAATLVADGLKGAAAVLLPMAFTLPWLGLLGGLFAVIGHVYPVWLRFRGGKGVATGLGVVLAAAWPVGILACLVWLLVARLTRISSAGALTAFAATPVLALVLGLAGIGPAMLVVTPGTVALYFLAIAALVFSRHKDNIARLLAGTEPRIGRKQ